MNNLFKFSFDILTDPLGLPIDPIYEYIILAVISYIAYKIAYSKVGYLKDLCYIDNRTISSFLHWTIRLIVFVIMWAITYGIIQAYFFVTANWQLILMITASIVGTAAICTLAVFLIRVFKKHRTVNNNA